MAGATGYTGRAVVSALRQADADVVAHVRPDSASLESWRRRFEGLGARVDSTPWETEAIRNTLAFLQPTLVFALLGTTRSRVRRVRREQGKVESYASVDVGLTMMLYEAAQRAPSRPRFVYLSALGVSPDSGNEYLAARALVEGRVQGGELSYLIARPSFITGPDREEFRPAERIGALISDAVLWLGSLLGARRLRDRYRSTTPAILAGAMVRLALNPGSPSRVYQSEELR